MTISQMKPRNFLERIVCFFYIFFFFSDRHESAEGFENGVGGFNGNPCLRLFHFVLRRRQRCIGRRQRLA